MATSNDSTQYVGNYNTTAASNVPPDSGATGKRYQGAAEIRQIKKVLKDSFPSVTGAVTATHTQLNQLATNTLDAKLTVSGAESSTLQDFVGVGTSFDLQINSGTDDFEAICYSIALERAGAINSAVNFHRASNATSGYLSFTTAGTEKVRFDSSGNVGIGETAPDYKLDVNGSFGFTPGTSVTPADNGDVVFELTNNTTLTIKAKGSDGTVRTATVTLA